MTTTTTPITKSYDLKDLTDEGSFSAVISTSTPDREGDIVSRGAFNTSLGKEIPLLVGHDWVAGGVGKGVVSQTDRGAVMTGQFFLNTGRGKEAYEQAKSLGSLAQFSIGFSALDSDVVKVNGAKARRILDLELHEASMVTVGASYNTGLLSIKSARPGDPPLDRWYAEEFGGADDELSVKSLSKRGYDVQAGWLQHKGVNLYPAGVAEAPKDDDTKDLLQLRHEARTTMHPLYATAFWKWFAGSRMHGDDFVYLARDELKALSEGVDSAGGYSVPADFRARIESYRAQTAVVRPYATVIPCGRDQLILPMAAPHSTAPNSYASDLTASWYSETPATWASADPAFQAFVIAVRKLRAPLTVSGSLWDDQPALAAFIAENGGANLALAEDYGFISGATALEPRGMLNSGLTGVDVEGSTANTISNSVSNAGSMPKLISLVGGLPSQYRANSRWIMRSAIENDIRLLVGVDGQYAFPRLGDVLQGYSLHYSDAVPDDGVDGNQVVIYGDVSSYFIADRLSLSIQVLTERFAETDQVGILLKTRAGGGLLRANGIVIGTV